MPKPQRCRRICHEPQYTKFSTEKNNKAGSVILLIDEFEVIRLVDFERKTHQECAEIMDISRTTVTEIYDRARKKIADCIVNGKNLEISGGNYRLCDGSALSLCKKKCCKQRNVNQNKKSMRKKGDMMMRIAVTYENGDVFQHFGKTKQFKLYDVEDGNIVFSDVLDTNGSGHGALATFLQTNEVDVLICGGIGTGAKDALNEAGIQLYGGVLGNADEKVNDFIHGELSYHANIACHHHDEEGHTCGEHGCGKH